ncbi:PACE efflux transporter [Paucibacter sp. B2R-40]|uniref:PACE efflux transporter n=1 Tax=Paucibacter sp. B2R-40 TaxID=2893554 RepID=UPI0021E40E31|nr:PACE efflux transporter [Paucibacter sp. B2R-40]MCV2356907.1 PACE efflux transporter [Paucibacter sp. B2R-40]
MKPRTRRVVQAVLYEVFAVAAVGPALGLIFDEPLSSTLGLALLMSTVALSWNYVFNGWFERWEATQAVKGRSLKRRLAHGIGFEGGLVVLLVPLMAWWLDTSLLKAFVVDLGVLAFFFVYAVVFTWGFDRVFGLPDSAAPTPEI